MNEKILRLLQPLGKKHLILQMEKQAGREAGVPSGHGWTQKCRLRESDLPVALHFPLTRLEPEQH